MRLLNTLTCTLVGAAFASAVSAPDVSQNLVQEAAGKSLRSRSAEPKVPLVARRRGGGGGGGGGSRGGNSGGNTGSNIGSTIGATPGSTSGSTSGGSSGGSSSRPRLPRRPKGGRNFGNSRFLPGGSAVSYRSGQPSPGGITPFRQSSTQAAAIFPGTWAAGVFVYAYTLDNDDIEETELDGSFVDDLDDEVPVRCLCEEFLRCSCEREDDEEYLRFLIDDDDVEDLAEDVVTFNEVNGTTTLVINGTVANATETPSDLLADDSDSDDEFFDDSDINEPLEPLTSAGIKQAAVQLSGWSLLGGMVALMVAGL